MALSRRRGQAAATLSVHQILTRMYRNLSAATLQAWGDHSVMLNNTPPIVAIEINNNIFDNCNVGFHTRILELSYSNLSKCFRQKLVRSN